MTNCLLNVALDREEFILLLFCYVSLETTLTLVNFRRVLWHRIFQFTLGKILNICGSFTFIILFHNKLVVLYLF